MLKLIRASCYSFHEPESGVSQENLVYEWRPIPTHGESPEEQQRRHRLCFEAAGHCRLQSQRWGLLRRPCWPFSPGEGEHCTEWRAFRSSSKSSSKSSRSRSSAGMRSAGMISPLSLARGPNAREKAPGLPLNMMCHKGDGRSAILLFSGLWLS